MYNWQNIQKRIAHIENPIGTEIGVYQGVMSERLLENIPGLTLYMIDSWSHFTDDTDENIKIKYCDKCEENYKLVLDIKKQLTGRTQIYR